MPTLWESAVSSIAQRMSSRNFELWIQPLQFVSLQGDLLTLEAPNLYIKEWFEDNYLQSLRNELALCAGHSVSVQVLLKAEEIPFPASQDALVVEEVRDGLFEGTGQEPECRSSESFSSQSPASRKTPTPKSDLCTRYLFEHFVVGPSNQFAATAAELVSERPGEKYNPLFLYGGTGLGKTHLLQAIGHALLERHPTWQVTYVSSERFMNEFIACLRMKKMEEFRERYRQRCDVLLMDDVQFIAGKDNTENEFFHTFNALHERGRQIVLTSDRVVSEMPELRDRLKSRFQWGLIADILPPELDTRISILKQKARHDRISLPDDVAFFLAKSIQSNVRELEGALIRLAAFSSLQGLSITVEFAERTLAGLLQRNSTKVNADRIQREVAAHFNIRQSDLKSARRPRVISFPRQLAMHLCRKHTSDSLTEIGRHFGGKDHTTVLSADRKVRRLCEEEDETRSVVQSIERRLGLSG